MAKEFDKMTKSELRKVIHDRGKWMAEVASELGLKTPCSVEDIKQAINTPKNSHPLYDEADRINEKRAAVYEHGPVSRESYFITPIDNAHMIHLKALRFYAIVWAYVHEPNNPTQIKDSMAECLRDLTNYCKFAYDDLVREERGFNGFTEMGHILHEHGESSGS